MQLDTRERRKDRVESTKEMEQALEKNQFLQVR
jgi:hypothetical protein